MLLCRLCNNKVFDKEVCAKHYGELYSTRTKVPIQVTYREVKTYQTVVMAETREKAHELVAKGIVSAQNLIKTERKRIKCRLVK